VTQRFKYIVAASLVSLVVVLVGTLTSIHPANADPVVTTVMSGLDNPRGLAFGPDGSLYVAEAGRGGPLCVTPGFCVGPTGAVSRLYLGEQKRIATGLPSLARTNGRSANGPADVALLGLGTAFVTVGLQADPRLREQAGEVGPGFAQLVQLAGTSGHWRYVADVGTYQETHVPDPSRQPDSNPYGLLVEPGARIVTDASANSLLRIAANGAISTLAVFPSRPQRTPTLYRPRSLLAATAHTTSVN
jgi:hypothetical protein